uniref:Uncharacterized protein LOC8286754 n=1 Tax=Rhizophora mucronata TaxID=61149 RepID=A0A2P2ME90_RHIMU
MLGVWMDLRTRRIGGELLLIVRVAAAGVKRRGKLAYLVLEEIAEKQTAVLMVFPSEKQWRVEFYLPLIGGMMVVIGILGMKHVVIANGHLGGVLKTRTRNHGSIRRLMQKKRRKMFKMTINLLWVAAVPLLNVIQIHVINGGHDIEWRFILVGLVPTVLHQDLVLREDVLKAQIWGSLLDAEGQMQLVGVPLQPPLVPLTRTKMEL